MHQQAAGYDTGLDADKIDGEAVVAVLTALSQEAVVAGGPKRMAEMVGGCDVGLFLLGGCCEVCSWGDREGAAVAHADPTTNTQHTIG